MAARCLILENGCCLTLYLVRNISELFRELHMKRLKKNQGLLCKCMLVRNFIGYISFDMLFIDAEGLVVAITTNRKVEGIHNICNCQNTILLERGMIRKLGLHCGDYILI